MCAMKLNKKIIKNNNEYIQLKNNFHQILKKKLNGLNEILESEYCGEKLLFEKDIYGHNALMIASQYNPEAVKLILNSPYCGEELLAEKNKYGYNPFLMACKFQPLAVKLFLDSPYHNEKFMLEKNIYGENALMIACKYNYGAIEFILNSPYCDEKNLLEKNISGCNALMDACIFNKSNVVELIINSKYMDAVINEYRNINFFQKNYNYLFDKNLRKYYKICDKYKNNIFESNYV